MRVDRHIRQEVQAALCFNAERLTRGATGPNIVASVNRTVKQKMHGYVGRVIRVFRSGRIEFVSQGLNVLYRQIVLYGRHHGACRDNLASQR
jgi:hypothetical protein